MPFLEIVLVAVGLAADSFAVSVSSGAVIHKLRPHHAIRIAVFFSVFQGLMPWLGWKLGSFANAIVAAIDHWLAFALLCLIGGKMIYESLSAEPEENLINPLKLSVLVTLSIATSIDALAVGFTFSFLDIAIIEPVIVIGVVTFIFSLAGTYIGNAFGHIFERKIELAGGLILIGIGLKILLEHTVFAS